MEKPESLTQSIPVPAAEYLYDLSILEEMGDNEYMAEVLGIFLRDTPFELKEMKTALYTGNAKIIAQQAHKIKGSAGIIQAAELCGLLDRIEKAAKTETAGDILKSLIENTLRQYNNIEQALKKYIQELR